MGSTCSSSPMASSGGGRILVEDEVVDGGTGQTSSLPQESILPDVHVARGQTAPQAHTQAASLGQ